MCMFLERTNAHCKFVMPQKNYIEILPGTEVDINCLVSTV